jgi:cobalt-precorrin 5A hydrolase / precorrin-3B C17-methyltransferase
VNVLAVSITERGRETARRLPYEHVHGSLATTVRQRWRDRDGFVLCCAVGVAVRVVAPLLGSKGGDAAVVCVDEAGRFAVPVVGGHAADANDLARDVAALLSATPVVTTATEAAGLPGLDTLPGFTAEGDVAGVTRAWLDGDPPAVLVDTELALWSAPPVPPGGSGSGRVIVSDRVHALERMTVVLRPASLVIGVGASSGAPAAEIADLVAAALEAGGLAAAAVAGVATLDRKSHELGIVALGLPVQTFPAEVLRTVKVPNPSDVVDDAVGTPSVAEAAALTAAGPDAALVVSKRTSPHATVAVARRVGPRGHLAVVGLGPGGAAHRTPAAAAAVRHADVVVGYGPYVDQCADLLAAHHTVVRSPIGAEADRCREALRLAAHGRRVALVCSGDAGVFGMASLTLELAPGLGGPDVEVIPGVTAALAAGALLGAPLGHDHAFVSLSDLLTPWPVIERRLRAAAAADLAVALYNPRSSRRTWQLDQARAILLGHRPPETPVGVVTDAGRPGQRVERTTLAALDPETVSMLTTVIVGTSQSRWVGDRLVTPRGYPS